MIMQQTETMLNLTRFQRIKFMHKYSFIIIHLKDGLFSDKIQDKDELFFVEYNVTEDDKINETKNNEHK